MFTPPVADVFNITDSDVGRAITDFTHQMMYEGIERDARRVLRDLAPIETLMESRSGRTYMMRVQPYRTVEHRIDGIVMTFVDISARLGAERQAHESEGRYRQLFNSIDEGFCIIEVLFDTQDMPVDYRFLEVNSAFARQTGLSDAVGKTMRELVPQHEEHWFYIYGRVAMTRRPERFENYAAGLKRHYEGFAFPVGPPLHRQVGLLFNDVSQRKQFEEHLKLLVNELNHRVKNTLALVQAIAQQSLKREGVELGVRRAFEGRLATLAAAHNLLTQTHWECASLRKLVLSTFAGCGTAENRFSVQGPEVDLQATQAVAIAMALHELCTNAVKYGALSADAGHVHVRWYMTAASPPRLHRMAGGGRPAGCAAGATGFRFHDGRASPRV